MDNKRNIFLSSLDELKDIRTVTVNAMLIAISVILGYFTINIAGVAKIGFGSIPAMFSAYFFGPVVGASFGAVSDVVKYLVKPDGVFFIGFTLNAILTGFIRGSILYKKEVSLTRIIISELIITLLCNLIINTYLISVLQGKAFIALLPLRITKNMISLPINVLSFYILSRAFLPIKRLLKNV